MSRSYAGEHCDTDFFGDRDSSGASDANVTVPKLRRLAGDAGGGDGDNEETAAAAAADADGCVDLEDVNDGDEENLEF